MVLEALIQKIKESGLKKKEIAAKIGMTPQSFSNKLHGRSEFSAGEAVLICLILKIDFSQFAYFFAPGLENT